MKIVINSTKKFYKTTIPKCIQNIVDKDILVVVGGGEFTDIDYTDNNVKYVFVPYDNFDLNSFIYISELDEFDNFFYMHDTCMAGVDFYNSIVNKTVNKDSCYKLTNDGLSMNIGYYTFNSVKDRQEELVNLKNLDLSPEGRHGAKLLALQYEDFIFVKRETPSLCNGRQVTYDTNIYDTGVTRITEYYKDIDLYKYKSNWNLSKHKIQMEL